ncbi:hypothetical protein ACHAQA_004251 [Verticillium albo-atrum]
MRVATTFALALSAAATLVSAQRKVYNNTDLTDINNISDNERAEWCRGQRNVCDELCDPAATTNDCDYQTLDYDCTCSNGTAPGLQYYSDTLPTFICNRVFSECNAAAVGDATAQRACLEERDSVCGEDVLQNAFANSGSDSSSTATDETATTTTASETGSATAAETTADSTESSGGASETTTTGDSFAAPTAAPVVGAAAVAVAALAYLV